MTKDDVLAALGAAILDETGNDAEIRRDQTALEIDGWDSLAHARIIMNLEARLGVEIDMDRTYRLATVGDLVDLVVAGRG